MRDAYTFAVARLLFPLHERLKGHSTVAWRRELERSQWWPAPKILELQVSRLRELLRAALGLAPTQKFRHLRFQQILQPAPNALPRMSFRRLVANR